MAEKALKRKGGRVGQRRDERRRKAVQLRTRGMGALVIATQLGCSLGTVYELLREAKADAAFGGTIDKGV